VGNPAAEKNTFAAFLNAAPAFAGDKITNWSQPKQDPPDVLCTTEAGLQVGLELTGWLDNGQITDAKAIEAIEQSIRKALRPEPPNHTEHIHYAWLRTLPRARIKPTDEGAGGTGKRNGSGRSAAAGRTSAVTRRWRNTCSR